MAETKAERLNAFLLTFFQPNPLQSPFSNCHLLVSPCPLQRPESWKRLLLVEFINQQLSCTAQVKAATLSPFKPGALMQTLETHCSQLKQIAQPPDKHFPWQMSRHSCPQSSRTEDQQEGGLERDISSHRFTGDGKGDVVLTFWVYICQAGGHVSGRDAEKEVRAWMR